jgi:hypothetical protein
MPPISILFFRRWGKAVSSPLKTPLEMEQMFRLGATRAPVFVNLCRHAGHVNTVMRAPLTTLGRERGEAGFGVSEHSGRGSGEAPTNGGAPADRYEISIWVAAREIVAFAHANGLDV